jgi:hypothetical protein
MSDGLDPVSGGPRMRADHIPLPPRYLRTKEAAQFLSLSARTLEKHRTYGTGPAYHKLGVRIPENMTAHSGDCDRHAHR